MKSVTLSDIVRVPDWQRSASGLRAERILASLFRPLAQPLAGRLQVTTRFQASLMVGTLDEALDEIGYASAARMPGKVRYRAHARSGGWRKAEITVAVHDHALDVTGPVAALHALRRRLAC